MMMMWRRRRMMGMMMMMMERLLVESEPTMQSLRDSRVDSMGGQLLLITVVVDEGHEW